MKILDPSIAAEVANKLLEIQAIRLQPTKPFTWASGWKSPIYCDNRLSLSFPEVRNLIKANLVKSVQHFFPEVEAIAGVATAGIPQGALISDELNLPFIYVRSKPKGHGMENMIEGKVTPGQKIVVVEDLVSTGGSSLKAAQDLRNAGFEVLGISLDDKKEPWLKAIEKDGLTWSAEKRAESEKKLQSLGQWVLAFAATATLSFEKKCQ